MSILNEAFERCIRLHKMSQDDGYGGQRTVWVEGAEFDAAFAFDTSIEARTAGAQGVKNLYTVTTRRGNPLEYHDVFRRLSDGKIFRATSDGTDKKTPPSATLDMSQVTAEEYTPTDG